MAARKAKDKWALIYEAASNGGDQTWWLHNDNGWCPKCHKHRSNAGWWEGTCFACGTDLEEATVVGVGSNYYYPYYDGEWSKHRSEERSGSATCPRCDSWFIPMASDYDEHGQLRCWKCNASIETEGAINGKEVRLVSSQMPDILVERDAHAYAMAVVQECPGEVGGLGYVEKLDNGDLRIYEFAVIGQEATHGGVEFDDDDMHRFLMESAERDDCDNLRLSWHSHGNMGCFFSGTDTGDAIKKYKEAGTPWLLSLIFNRKQELATRLDIFDSDVADQIYLEDLKYLVERPTAIARQAKSDVKRLVRKPATWAEQQKQKQADAEAERKSKGGANSGASKSEPAKGRSQQSSAGSIASTEIEVVRGKAVPPIPTRRPNKRARKAMRHELLERSDFSISEIRKMTWQEVFTCLWYMDYLARNGNAVVDAGDALPDKPIHEMTDEEWVKYCEAEGFDLSPDTRRMLLANENDDWGGAT